jgi:hypothetical protein
MNTDGHKGVDRDVHVESTCWCWPFKLRSSCAVHRLASSGLGFWNVAEKERLKSHAWILLVVLIRSRVAPTLPPLVGESGWIPSDLAYMIFGRYMSTISYLLCMHDYWLTWATSRTIYLKCVSPAGWLQAPVCACAFCVVSLLVSNIG